MGSKNPIVGQIAKDYVKKYPQTSSRALARMMHKENPSVFKTLNDADVAVRYYRGALGEPKRKLAADKELFRPLGGYKLPEANEDRQVLPFKLPKDWDNFIIASDLHIPYHDNAALTAVLEYGDKNNVPGFVLNGDGMDFFSMSRYATDPRKRDLGNEIEKTKEFIALISKLYKKKLYKYGNHEERWEKYLWVKAPELTGVEIFELHNILELEKHGFLKVDSRAEILVGNNFTIVHGHEFQESVYSPVNPARGLYLRYEDNAICGHFHRPSHHSQKTGRGKIKATWSLGCLCLLRPEYATQNKWIHGFAHLTRESEHDFHVRNFKIIDGKIYEG